jgi:hypothetical protein
VTVRTAEDQFARLVDDDQVDIDDGLAAARARRGQQRLGGFDGDSLMDDSDDSADTGSRKRGSMAPSLVSNEDDEPNAVRLSECRALREAHPFAEAS